MSRIPRRYGRMLVVLALSCGTTVYNGNSHYPTYGQPVVCTDIAQADGVSESGVFYCADGDVDGFGFVERGEALACSGDPRLTVPACKNPGAGACATDKDCGVGEACGADPELASCQCYSVCSSDSDCDSDEACLCALSPVKLDNGGGAYVAATMDLCVPAECRVHSDCLSEECAAALSACGSGGDVIGFYCRTDNDECRMNSDCSTGDVCTYSPAKNAWACMPGKVCE
jgi:hypothetical protein